MWAGQACGGTRAGSVRCAGANQGRRAGLHCCASQPSAEPLQNSAEFCRILVLQAAQRRGAQLRGGAEELGRGRRGDVPCVEADGAHPECTHFVSSLPTTLNWVVSQLRRCLYTLGPASRPHEPRVASTPENCEEDEDDEEEEAKEEAKEEEETWSR